MTPDEDLATLAQRGDRASFDVLVDRHARRVFLFAYTRLRDRHDAEEAAQVLRCIPDRVSITELRTVVVRHVAAEPASRALQAAVLVREALARNYACD